MSGVMTIVKRELVGYFVSPVAYVFLVIFLLLTGFFTFTVGNFFERGEASLVSFFTWHPWLYLFLVPAVGMRLWSEERRLGTMELLLTQPVQSGQAVLGKFFAAWAFVALALALSFPLWLTVNWLGDPDNGVIFASYLGSLLMAGAYLAVGSCLSATTRSQVVAFVVTILACLLLLLAGFPLALDPLRSFLPQSAVDAASGLSFLTHFQAIMRGVLDLRDVLYFLLVIAAWLAATVLVIEIRKAD